MPFPFPKPTASIDVKSCVKVWTVFVRLDETQDLLLQLGLTRFDYWFTAFLGQNGFFTNIQVDT